MEGRRLTKEYKETIIPLTGKVNGCRTEIIKASLLLAQNMKVRIDGVTGERVDLQQQLREIGQKREAEAAARAEQERIAAEEQAKKDTADAARRKRLAAERKKKDAELDVQLAKHRAEEEAKAAEERQKIRAACALIYRNTVDKKITDLTVREEQQVRACQALGLYPPQ
jgi:membrane protein involved in colicin uptake